MAVEFRHAWKELGESYFTTRPRPIIVPILHPTLILLSGATRWTAGPGIQVTPIKEKTLFSALNDFIQPNRDVNKDPLVFFADLWVLLKLALSEGDLLLAVKGDLPGQSWLQAGAVKQSLVVTKAESCKVSFKFLKQLDEDGQLVPATKWRPADVKDWISELNWIFGAQVNIWFESIGEKWIEVHRHLGKVNDEDYKNFIVGQRDKSPDVVTVFLVGSRALRSDGVSSSGTYDPLTRSVPIKDTPPIPVTKLNDPFVVNLAHELVHFLIAQRGNDPSRGGHARENYVLLNKQTESTVIGSEVFNWLFPLGKY